MSDVAIIDLEAYSPNADFENPRRMASGVVYLLVNGGLAIDGGKATDTLSGVTVHRQELDCSN